MGDKPHSGDPDPYWPTEAVVALPASGQFPNEGSWRTATGARPSRPFAPADDPLACPDTRQAGHGLIGGSMTACTNSFALDLYSTLRRKDANLFFSPFSVAQAVGMVLLGARGDTHAEIAAMLAPDGPAASDAAWQVEGRVRAAAPKASGAAPTGTTLRAANALWAGADVRFEAAFAAQVEREFGGSIASIDFTNERAARDRINDWVLTQTEGRIRDLIAPGALTHMTRLVLTNAVHFKAAWALPFPAMRTERQPFRCGGDKRAAVDMMRVTGHFRLSEQDGVKVLTIPYHDGRASMVVVLPDKGDGLEAVEARLSAATLNGWTRAGESVRVGLVFPKFESGSVLRLKDALATLGMRRAFEPAQADLRGIAAGPLFVGDVVHRSFVRVDEAGTEATAATAVLTPRGKSAASSATPFVADHPFLYLIREEESGRIVFMGRMMNPTAKA